MSGRITVPMAVYTAEVVATEDLSPTLRRVVLGGQGLAGYRTTGVGDEYIRLLFPAEGTKEPVLPTITAGALDYGSIDLNLLRTYTVRRFDADRGQVTVDFVVHGHGVATTWARRAIPGDLVGLNSPTGLYDPPADLAWQVLVADLAGLPALARLLEQTPEGGAHPSGRRGAGARGSHRPAAARQHHDQLGARRQRKCIEPARRDRPDPAPSGRHGVRLGGR